MKRFWELSLLLILSALPLGAEEPEPLDRAPVPEEVREGVAEVAEEEKIEYGRGMSPGLSANVLFPLESDKVYWGGGLHYVFVQAVAGADDFLGFGGFLELYSEIQYFKEQSSAYSDDILFTYTVGLTLSFEKFMEGSRNFLIPTFGVQTGGIYINDQGNGILLIPQAGLVLFSNSRFSLAVDGRLYLNTVNLRDFIGPGVTVNISMNL